MTSNAKNLKTVLGALIKNKLRFSEATSKNKRIGYAVLFGFAYLIILSVVLGITVSVGKVLVMNGMGMIAYLLIILIGAAIVLIFGIINLVSTLYLAKDTDFYSMLPVNPTIVFSAKILFVYLSEAVIVAAVVLPAMIAFGIIAEMQFGYYIISLLMLPIIPALPLIVAAILAIPVMYIAGKTKNRNIVPFIFYCVMFCGFFALYFYLMFSSMSTTGEEITQEQIESIMRVTKGIGYALYPYTALSSAALGIPTYGLSAGMSVFVNLVIFIGASAALGVLLLLLGKTMYGQSAKANNQTNNSVTKKTEFKSATCLKALIKREFSIAVRTPATTFQCFGVMLFPIVFSVLLSLGFNNLSIPTEDGSVGIDSIFKTAINLSVLIIFIPALANAAITSFSREGTALASLKVLPVSAKTIVKAKCISWSIVAIPSSLISAVIVNAFNFDVLNFVLSMIAFAVIPVIYVVFGVLWDMSAPKLIWNDPIQAIKHNTHATVGQIFGIVSGLVLTFAAGILPMIFGGSRTAVMVIFWTFTAVLMIAFSIVDFVLFKSVNLYYNKAEI